MRKFRFKKSELLAMGTEVFERRNYGFGGYDNVPVSELELGDKILVDDYLSEVVDEDYVEEKRISAEQVFENMKNLIGKEFDADDVICAFEDFEEFGESYVVVEERPGNRYGWTAYISSEYDGLTFMFELDEDETIVDVYVDWGYEPES